MESKRERLFREYKEMLSVGVSVEQAHSALADKWQITKSAVRGTLSKARNSVQVDAPTVKPKVIMTITRRDKSTDADRWQDALADMRRKQYVTVAHISDIHIPYQDDNALGVAYKVVNYLQPDCVVTLSDGFDFAGISKFAHDPDLPDIDVIENVQPGWMNHVDAIRQAAPKTVIRAILGNHDWRLYRFLAEVAPQIRGTMLHAFDEVVRYRESVLMPDYLSEMDIGPVTVMHGNGSTLGQYGAKRQLEARRFQRFVISGHAHAPGFHMARGPEKAVASIVNGCHCVSAHYRKDTTYDTWIRGLGYAVIDMKANYAWLHNVIYEQVGGELVTSIGNRTISHKITTRKILGNAA